MSKIRIIIMGAAGRDFHNHNVFFRGHPLYEVVAFTATQIPNIDNRRYPPELAGPGYPNGIPIREESELEDLIAGQDVDQVIFAYSDVPHEYVMHIASRVLAAGADFRLMGGKATIKKLLEIDPKVKVIVSSGYSNDPIMADYRKYGFSNVITKPYKAEELREVLNKILK